MGALGSLNVDLSAEIAQFVGAMDKAAYRAEQTGKQIERSMDAAGQRIQTFAIGTVAAFASFQTIDHFGSLIKGSIDAMAALDDMAERTGNTVESLSGLVQVAKVGGHDVGVMEQAITKLTKGMVMADEETKGAGAALAFLNIKAKDAQGNLRPTADLMQEIAGKLDKYADGTGKAAIAQALFGKSGAAVLPFLKDLAEQGELVTKVTAEQAAQAEQYQKTLGQLAIAKEDLVRTITTSVLPVMKAVADIYLQSKTAADSTLESTRKLAEDGSITTWAEKAALALATVIDYMRTTAATLSASAGSAKVVANDVKAIYAGIPFKIAELFGNDDAKEFFENRTRDLEDANKKWADLLNSNTTSTADALRKQLALNKELAAATAAARIADLKEGGAFAFGGKLQAGFDGGTEAAAAAKALEERIKKAATEAEKLQALRDKIFNKEAGLDAGFNQDLRFLEQQLGKNKISVEEYRKTVDTLILQQPVYVKARAEAVKVDGESFRLMDELRKRYFAAKDDTLKLVEGMEFELEAMKLTNTEREIAIRLRDMEQKGVVKGSAEYEEYAARIRAAVEAKDGLQGQIDLFKSIESVAHQTWQSVTQGGKGAAERIRDSFKNGVYELLYQLTLKPFYINVVANLTGQGGTGSAVSNALGGGGAFGNIFGNLSKTIGGIGQLTGSTALSGFSAGLSNSPGMLALVEGQTTAEAVAASSSFSAGSSLAALGPYLAAAGIAYALYSAFAKPRGGAKEGGSFVGTYDPTGALQSSKLGTLFGVSSDNTNVAKISEQYSKSYFDILKQLGGTAAPMITFGLGYDSDPRGTAQNRIKSNVSIGGQSVYNVMDREFGRDNAQIGPQLQLEASRMLLVALQNSSLPPALTKVFNSVTASSATQEQIDAVMKSAQALKGIFDSFEKNPLEDAAAQIEDGQNAMAAAVRRNSDALQKLIDQYDGSAAAAEALAGATSQYYLAQVSLLAQFEEIRRSVTGMFDQTLRSIELAGLDKQQQYDFYQREADAFLASLLGSSDVNEIQRLAEKINADINAAFGLLSPEEQQRESSNFLERGRETQRLIDEQIQKAVKEASDRTRADMDLVREALTKGTEPLQAAATTFTGAVNTFAGAVNGGININVNVPLEVGP